jgi:hypothetical protein
MGECDVVAHEHGGKRPKRHLVGDEAEHLAHIHQEIDSLITEKDPEEDSDYIQPLGMMGVAPVFYTLYEVHDGSILSKKMSFQLNIRTFSGHIKGWAEDGKRKGSRLAASEFAKCELLVRNDPAIFQKGLAGHRVANAAAHRIGSKVRILRTFPGSEKANGSAGCLL